MLKLATATDMTTMETAFCNDNKTLQNKKMNRNIFIKSIGVEI